MLCIRRVRAITAREVYIAVFRNVSNEHEPKQMISKPRTQGFPGIDKHERSIKNGVSTDSAETLLHCTLVLRSRLGDKDRKRGKYESECDEVSNCMQGMKFGRREPDANRNAQNFMEVPGQARRVKAAIWGTCRGSAI